MFENALKPKEVSGTETTERICVKASKTGSK